MYTTDAAPWSVWSGVLTFGFTEGFEGSRVQGKVRFVFSLDPLTPRILEPKPSALAFRRVHPVITDGPYIKGINFGMQKLLS